MPAVVALLVGWSAAATAAQPHFVPVASSTPAPTSDSSGWPAGGRFQDAGFADTGTLASRIYARHIPPELAPSVFLFQRVESGGYQAELDFPAPVIQLHYYSPSDSGDDGEVNPSQSVPVRHTVDLVLQPPSGGATSVSLKPDGTTVVTRGGTQVGTSKTVLIGTRLIMAVPASVGVQRDWTVEAVIRVQGDQPLARAGGEPGLPATLSAVTEPAVVGVLTGDDATGAEPTASTALLHTLQVAVQAPDPHALPSGSRPVSLRLEQGVKGLVAVVTLDSAPKPATTIAGQPVNQEELYLSLAPGVQDGLGVGRIGVSYPYPVCPSGNCPVARSATVVLRSLFLGTVPVTVSGSEVRFDFGGFTPAPATSPRPQPTPSGKALGTFSTSYTLGADDLDFIPVGGTAAVKPEPITVSLDGTNVSFKRASGSEAATGSVNPLTGYFFATNSTEMWSGWWGKAGWYSRVQSMTPAAARLRPPVADITKHPATLDTVARDLWIEKVRTLEDQTAFVIPFDPFGLLLLNRPNDSSDVPPEFRHAVAQFLAANGGLTQDTLDRAFPGGYDPIVVPPPNPLAFPLAGVVPGLSPQGAQREIATGMRILDRAGEGIRSLSPYVPGSALLVTAGGSPGAAGATPSAPGTVGTSSSSGGGSGLVVGVVVAVAAVAGGIFFGLRRRSRRAGTP